MVQRVKLGAAESLEWTFHSAAHLSWKLVTFIGYMMAASAACWVIVFPLMACCCKKCSCLTCLLRLFLQFTIPVFSSYFGLIYVMYILTLPICGKPDKGFWIAPAFPHFGPIFYKPEEDEKLKDKFFCLCTVLVRLVRNGIVLVIVPYIFLLALVFGLCCCIVIPVVFVLKGILVVVARGANEAAKLALEGGKSASAENEEEEEPEVCRPELKPIACWQISLRQIWRAFLISVMFVLDFLILFSIMVNVGYLFPSLMLPSYDIDLFGSLDIPQFILDFAIFFKNVFSIFKIPDWDLRCNSFDMLSSLVNLFGTTFAVSVVISSDIIAVVYDRQNRLNNQEPPEKESKVGEAAEGGAAAASSPMPGAAVQPGGEAKETVDKKEPEEPTALRQLWRKLTVEATKLVVGAAQYLIWPAVTVITNSVSLYIVYTWQRVQEERGGIERTESFTNEWAATETECTWGMHGLGLIMSTYIAFCTFFYCIRVLTGLVYKDGTWILTAALVQEEKLLTWLAWARFKAILRLSLGAFFLPGCGLGLTKKHMIVLRDKLYERQTVDPLVDAKSTAAGALFFCEKCFLIVTTEDQVVKCKKKQKGQGGGPEVELPCSWKVVKKEKVLYYCTECHWEDSSEEWNKLTPKPTTCPDCLAEPQNSLFVKGVLNISEGGKACLADLTMPVKKTDEKNTDEKKGARVFGCCCRAGGSGGFKEELVKGIISEEGDGKTNDSDTCTAKLKSVKKWLSKLSAKEVLAEALLDMVVDDNLIDFPRQKIMDEYEKSHKEKFDLSNIKAFRLADFLDASIHASEMREKASCCFRLQHLFYMPFGRVNGIQYHTIHAPERCILWKAQLEMVVRATGQSFAITVFAVPFIGPLLGKAFMYLNEVPAFVTADRNVDAEATASIYSFKQESSKNFDFLTKGPQGVGSSTWLQLLYLFSFIKVGLQFFAVYNPETILYVTIIVFGMSLVSGQFVIREERIWRQRNLLLEEQWQNTRRLGRQRLRQLKKEAAEHIKSEGLRVFGAEFARLKQRRDDEKNRKNEARQQWEVKAQADEKGEREKIVKARVEDKVDDIKITETDELRAIPYIDFERIRDEGVDAACQKVEKFLNTVVEVNSGLRQNIAKVRRDIMAATQQTGGVLNDIASRRQKNQPEVVKKALFACMPDLDVTMQEMVDTHTVDAAESLNQTIKNKVSQWKLLICSLNFNDIDATALGKTFQNIVPGYSIQALQAKVKDGMAKVPMDLDFGFDKQHPFEFDATKIFLKKGMSKIIDDEFKLIKKIIDVAVGILSQAPNLVLAFETATSGMAENAAAALEQVEELDEEMQFDAELRGQAALHCKEWKPGDDEPAVVKAADPVEVQEYTFTLDKAELMARCDKNKHQIAKVKQMIEDLCQNVINILRVVKDCCEHAVEEIQKAVDTMRNRGILGWIDLDIEWKMPCDKTDAVAAGGATEIVGGMAAAGFGLPSVFEISDEYRDEGPKAATDEPETTEDEPKGDLEEPETKMDEPKAEAKEPEQKADDRKAELEEPEMKVTTEEQEKQEEPKVETKEPEKNEEQKAEVETKAQEKKEEPKGETQEQEKKEEPKAEVTGAAAEAGGDDA